jgi:hypothetical protein
MDEEFGFRVIVVPSSMHVELISEISCVLPTAIALK